MFSFTSFRLIFAVSSKKGQFPGTILFSVEYRRRPQDRFPAEVALGTPLNLGLKGGLPKLPFPADNISRTSPRGLKVKVSLHLT